MKRSRKFGPLGARENVGALALFVAYAVISEGVTLAGEWARKRLGLDDDAHPAVQVNVGGNLPEEAEPQN